MKLMVAADSIFYKTPDNKYWCKTIYSYSFWKRYLYTFDKIIVVSRTKAVDYEQVNNYLRADGPGMSVIELPYMRGMKDYIKNVYSFNKSAKVAIKDVDCAIFRLPSIAAELVLSYYKNTKKPYGIEVVADPYDAYHTNKLAQIFLSRSLKRTAQTANGVSYVTKMALQEKYPSFERVNGRNQDYFETYYSTIDLHSNYFSKPKTYSTENKGKLTLIHTANSINNDNKGHTTVINVVKELRNRGYNANVIFIGDGTKRRYYEKICEEKGIVNHVKFTGTLNSFLEVRDYLLKGDIFIFPTVAEGLPRAIIEAMAVGLPVLSTPVNGIPELLEEEFMYEPSDVTGYTNKIISLWSRPEKLNKISMENVNKAREYSFDQLTAKRNDFYKKLKLLSSRV